VTTFERSAWVDASLDEVWAFHVRPSGLEALTPDWFHLRVEAVRGPAGESDSEELESGARIRASVRPLGVGPRQRWTSQIVARERDDGTAYFRDVMVDGPVPEWEHTHLFYGDGDRTLVRDRVEYALPGGSLGRRVAPLALVGLEPTFRYRHRRTKELLE